MDKGKLHLQIISPNGYVFDDYCHMASIPADQGVIGVMPHHESVAAALKEGVITVYGEKEQVIKEIDILGGFAEILDEKLLVLTDK